LGSTKWGFLINEDLGGGYSTVAGLESGVDINTGKMNNGGRLFGRQAYVGLGSPFGTVLMGRQYDLVLDSLIGLSASGRFNGILATHAADVDNVWGNYSLSNSIKYISPTYAGFKLSGLLSLGAWRVTSPTVRRNRSASVRRTTRSARALYFHESIIPRRPSTMRRQTLWPVARW
jgi:predicted porin